MIVSAVTPGHVAPSLDATDGTQGGANRLGTASRPVAGSHAGVGSSAGAAADPARPAGAAVMVADGFWAAATGPDGSGAVAVVAGAASRAGAGRLRRGAGVRPGVGSRTVNPLPPPGLPAAARSGWPVGSSASPRRTAAVPARTNRYRASEWAKAATTLFGPPAPVPPAPGAALPLRSAGPAIGR